MTENDENHNNDTGLGPQRLQPESDAIVEVHLKSLGYVLARTQLLFRQRMIKALDGTGLHMGQVVILASLRAQNLLPEESPLTQTRLTQISGIEKSSLVLFLDALEKEGWVERRRHPTDRRAHLVHLTASGAERFDKVGQRLQENENECLAIFNDTECKQISDLLQRLMQHMQALELPSC